MKAKYEVVISGMAGVFPESSDIAELKEKLMQKINLVTSEEKKWSKEDLDVPIYAGKLPESDAFDAMFFGIPYKHADPLDINVKRALEVSYSAIIDAGLNPSEIGGTNTAVLSCCCIGDSEYEKSLNFKLKSGALITGLSKGMQSNRVSFHLNARGPSYTIDGSWNGCFEAIKYAQENISTGVIKAAIITTCSLMYLPESSYHFLKMGRLNSDGCTKCFSDNADGYSRSEASVAFFMQRKEDALRNYGSVLGVSISNQEAKTSQISAVSPGQYLPVLEQVYRDHNIDPLSVAYVEAAGCASKVLDAEELNTIAEVFLPGRKEPLPVGCVKSNLGHCESSSDAVGLVKALFAADSGTIAPNLHYTSPNSMVPALVSGELKVVTEPTALPGNIIGINSISSIASIKHLILKQHDKAKKTEPKKWNLPPDGIPRLFIMSGRNWSDIEQILNKVEAMPIDPEFIALTHRVFKNGIKNHMFRAYTVINDRKEQYREINDIFTGEKAEPVWFVFTGMGSQWPGMGRHLMKLPKFVEAIKKCHKVLEPYGVNVTEIITSEDPAIFNNVFNSFIGIAAIQIGLVDILYDIGIVPDGIIGHSVGELGCAYADGCLTAEQVILCAFARGTASIESILIPGLMAAVGKGYNQIKDSLPQSIDVACHNSKSNCTLSGPKEQMEEYVESLKKQNVFARLVNTGNIAYHSRYIQPAGDSLLESLKQVIPEPKLRSKKWISTSIAEKYWDTELAKYCSAEYQTNNLLSSVLFEESTVHIPPTATIIEIAPHGLLQPILKQCFPSACHIPLTKRGHKQGLIYLCQALGKAYNRGHTIDLEKLYPPVEYPVSRGTETLSNLLTWDHSNTYRPKSYLLKEYEKEERKVVAKRQGMETQLRDLKQYQLQGVPVIPLGTYLELCINEMKMKKGNDFHLVQLKDIKFPKYQEISGNCNIGTTFQVGTGHWQFWKGDEEVVQGQITSLEGYKFPELAIVKGKREPGTKFYERLNRSGLKIGPDFKLIKAITGSLEEVSATIVWDGRLSNFLEAVLQVPLAAYKDAPTLLFVNKISNIIMDLDMFPVNEKREFNVYFNKITNVLYCDGLEISNITVSPVIKKLNKDVVCQEPQFFPYDSSSIQDLSSFLTLVQEIVYNNFVAGSFEHKGLEILEVGEVNFHNELYNVFQNAPGLNVNFKIIPVEKKLSEQEKEQYKVKNVLMVTASLSPQSMLGILENMKDGFVLVRDQVVPSEFEVITSKKDGNNIYSLCKKRETQNGRNSFVFLSSQNWESELKYHLNSHENQKVCLVGYVTKISKMCYLMQKTSSFNNSHNLRYLFHDIAFERDQTNIFEAQLSKGLRINILHHNQWSFISNKTISPTFQPFDLYNTFKFSQVLLEDMDVQAIGLNPKDFSGLHNMSRVVEYSGTKDREYMCGIGTIDEISQTISPDGILKWKKPRNWSHEEISSVLLPYSLAYSIINAAKEQEKTFSLKTKKVLVHRGSLPFSQALINIAEHEGFEVFTSYKDNLEKQLIKKLFPKIPSTNIVSCESSEFCYSLLPKSSDDGFSFVVSCLPEKEMVKANTLLTTNGGIFYQTGYEKSDGNAHMGMLFFLKSTLMVGLTPSTVIHMSDDEKEEIRDCLENGFKSGIIKPLPVCKVKNDIDNNSAIELIKNSSFINERLVLTPNGKSVKGSHLSLARNNGHYIIIVPPEGQGHLWIDILEWLVCRRALNIHVILDWSMQPAFIYEKFEQLKNKTSRCVINVKTTEELDTAGKMRKYIMDIKQKSKLSSVFISSEEHPEKLKAICAASGDARIIYFTEYIDETFEESSVNGLLVVDQSNLLDADIFKSVIDSLVQLPKNVLILRHTSQLKSSIVVNDPWKKYNQHLPWTFNEVASFPENSKTIGWKEVRTSTLKFQHCIGSVPVLIIPPIKKGQLDKLTKSLFYPAFQAVIPSNTLSALELAKELYKGAMALKTIGFTLLCSDWSSSIGIQLGKLLESAGRRVSIVFFQPSIKLDSQKLYQALHQKVTDEVKQYAVSERKRKLLQAGFDVLKNRFDLIHSNFVSSEVENKLQGFVVLVKNKLSTDYMSSELCKHCKNEVVVHNSAEGSYLDMMNSKETAAVVNSVALVYYPDAATSVPMTYTIKRDFDNPRHEYFTRIINDSKGK